MKTFSFDTNWYDALESFSDKKFGKMMRVIIQFTLSGVEPESLDAQELIVWKLIQPQLIKQRNKDNGKAGRKKEKGNKKEGEEKNQIQIKIKIKFDFSTGKSN